MTRPKTKPQSPAEEEFDTLVPDPRFAEEMGITLMTVWRHDRDPEMTALGWPPPIRINKRKFRSRRQVEALKAALIKRAIEERGREVA